MRKFLKRILMIFLIALTLTTVNCFAKSDKEELKIKDIVSKEEGSLFDKTIAKTIGGIAQAAYDIATNEDLDIGFKTYEDMVFKGQSPFSNEEWHLAMVWYRVFAYISGSLILIGVISISYKMIASRYQYSKKK